MLLFFFFFVVIVFFFFNDTATTEIYTLSLHDALPISSKLGRLNAPIEERVLQFHAMRQCGIQIKDVSFSTSKKRGKEVTPDHLKPSSYTYLCRENKWKCLVMSSDVCTRHKQFEVSQPCGALFFYLY